MRTNFTKEELDEDIEASMRLQQEVDQARGILNRNGLCPIDTDCYECIVLKIRSGSSGCNPKTAIKACKEFLGDSIKAS